MSQQVLFSDKEQIVTSPQFRIHRLQVFNWGTFSGLHDIAIAADGFLFVGRSGSGKSTLLDALSALLVPPLWLGFNTAAREGDKGRYDRNLPSYIRGAWADQKDAGSGEIATQYLRPTSTWSALALEYRNESGKIISLVQLYWLRGSSNQTRDVKRLFLVAERVFDIASEFKDFDFDRRKLKNKLHDVYPFEMFKPYSERFRRLLGIESEMALKLLHKTQSAKNLGDLNEFLRDFMLEKPRTFEVAERLVNEFSELDAAHQAVVSVRNQVNLLTPARSHYQQLLNIKEELVHNQTLISAIDDFRDNYKITLLQNEIELLRTTELGIKGQELRQTETLDNVKSELGLVEKQHFEQGGGQIESILHDKSKSEELRDLRLGKQQQARTACQQLGWVLSTTPQGHAALISKARHIVESWQNDSDQAEKHRDELRDTKKTTETEFISVRNEIEAMSRQASNIPYHMLELRQNITEKLGLSESDLPFVGELIEINQNQSNWQGAIERVLHGFALSILVDEMHYAAVSKYVNETRFNKRLVYYRVTSGFYKKRSPKQQNSLIHKVKLKDTSYTEWLSNELVYRFDYACVDNMKDFRQTERAITLEGQIRHGKSRHEKDDRHAIDDRRFWVLGFDNRDKLSLYQQRAQILATQISQIDLQLNKLSAEKKHRQINFEASLTFVNLAWHDIDVAGILDRIQLLEQQLKQLRSGNNELQVLGERIETLKHKIQQAENELREISVTRLDINNKIKIHTNDLQNFELKLTDSALTDNQQQGLGQYYSELDKVITLKNIDSVSTKVERKLNKENSLLEQNSNKLQNLIEKCFSEFIREWPVESADLDSTMASTPEFIVLLQRLENDGLPKYEERFFDMLKEQSTENLAALNKYMLQARKEIRERMEMVNESLAKVEFNSGTFLQIEVSDRHLPNVKEFRELVSKILEYAWNMEREQAESRFAVLRELVQKLASHENEHQRWREHVLDVRQHVEFIGRETDSSGNELEIYRSGAGKSGGQREKLATTCLAAALRYQLGGADDDIPIYAPVVLDEAFGKADNEFTELAMEIFTNFGFQMILATPLKSVMTLERFIGGACFIEISDRKHSGTLMIEYNQQNNRLNLPDNIRGQIISDKTQ